MLTADQVREQHPEIIALADSLRRQAVADAERYWPGNAEQAKRAHDSVRLRCIHDFDGTLLAGKPPEDLVLGPIPPDPAIALAESPAPPPTPYRGKPRPSK